MDTYNTAKFDANLEEYFSAAMEEREQFIRIPEAEEDYLTAATRILEKRREMQEVDEALQSKKDEVDLSLDNLKKRQDDLKRKEDLLKEALIKFDRFLKENDTKRHRAKEKSDVERHIQQTKISEIQQLKLYMAELFRRKANLTSRIKLYRKFEDYMQTVVDDTSDFNEVKEVMMRYETLASAYRDLKLKEERDLRRLDTGLIDLKKWRDSKLHEIMLCNNHLASVQVEFDEAESAYVRLESKWSRFKNTAAEKTLVLGRIKMAVHNMYLSICKQTSKQPTLTESETWQQLQEIQAYLQEVNEICGELEKLSPDVIEKLIEQGSSNSGRGSTGRASRQTGGVGSLRQGGFRGQTRTTSSR